MDGSRKEPMLLIFNTLKTAADLKKLPKIDLGLTGM
jgi:hypothetical protein